MTDSRWTGSPDHPFWKAASGKVPPPPAGELLRWRVLEAVLGSGRVRVQFEATTTFTNPLGKIQGGFLAAMLDDTVGPALATTLAADEAAPTIELKVNYLRPADPGIFVGEGSVVHRGGSVAFLEGRLLNAKGEVVATATATARIIKVAP